MEDVNSILITIADMSKVLRTIDYITIKYAGMTRNSGEPVACHSIQMAEMLNNAGYSVSYQLVALLHDVVEDTDTTIEQLKEDLPFLTEAEIAGVEALTKYDSESLEESIAKAIDDQYGEVIKGVDRLQNSRTTYGEKNTQEFIRGFIFKSVQFYVPALKKVNNQFLNELLTDLERLYNCCNEESKKWLNEKLGERFMGEV